MKYFQHHLCTVALLGYGPVGILMQEQEQELEHQHQHKNEQYSARPVDETTVRLHRFTLLF